MNDESKIVGILKQIIVKLCRFIAGFRLKVKKLFPGKSRTILLVGTSEVTVDFLLFIDEILEDIEGKKPFLVVSRNCREFARNKLSKYQGKITLISLVRAICSPWDIIIFSDHNNAGWFHPSIPKIQCSHGIESGKTYGPGGNYIYGRNSLDKKGNLLYDLMFIESSYYLETFIHDNPTLKGKVAIVGNMMADDLIAMNQSRETVRRKLGIQAEDRVLLIFSTWGPHSLIQRFGMSLLNEIPELSETYKIYLFIHPLNDRTEFPNQNAVLKFVEIYKRNGMAKRIEPLESSLPYLVAADVAFTDHGSLILYYALLNKPYLFVPVVTDALIEEALIWKFYSLQKKYKPDFSLKDQLDCAINNFPAKQHQELTKLIVDKPGNARERIRAEIARFL